MKEDEQIEEFEKESNKTRKACERLTGGRIVRGGGENVGKREAPRNDDCRNKARFAEM